MMAVYATVVERSSLAVVYRFLLLRSIPFRIDRDTGTSCTAPPFVFSILVESYLVVPLTDGTAVVVEDIPVRAETADRCTVR